MAIIKAKPTSPGRRGVVTVTTPGLHKGAPHAPLVEQLSKNSGRNNMGRITVRHRGGGVKQTLRIIDFKQDKFDIPARVVHIEYDPNRGARIALLTYADGEKRYSLAVDGLGVGETVVSSKQKIEITKGNRMPVQFIPAGIEVCNVELVPGRGGQIARGAGNVVSVMSIDRGKAQLKMPSGEIRLVPQECLATVGKESNPDKRLIKLGKAGRTRYRGIRPTVRGTAMNPVDHPHGGGEGNQPIGLKAPKTKWGKKALGIKTRKPKRSDQFIVQRRQNRKRK